MKKRLSFLYIFFQAVNFLMPSKAMRSKLCISFMQLLLWLSNSLVPLKASQVSPKPPRLNILYLTNIPLTERTKTSLAQFERNLTENAGLNLNVQMTSQVLRENSTTVLKTLHELNKRARWKETRFIILNMNNGKIQKMILYGYNGLVFDIRTRPTDMKQVYQSTQYFSSVQQLHCITA